MLSVHEIEGLRRSLAMAPLGRRDVDELIATCAALLAQRAQVADVLARLPESWAEVRAALNELQRLVQ